MNLEYFKTQIRDELDGAKEYIEKAIESKISHPSWSNCFVGMSDAEIEHATKLMKMMEECMRKNRGLKSEESSLTSSSTVNPETVYKDMMKEYGETMTYVTNMKRGLV